MSRNSWKSKLSVWAGRATVAVALTVVATAPAMAQSKMSGGKMSGGHMMGGKMSHGKMGGKMSGGHMMMSAMDKKTMMGMTAAEKAVCMMPKGAKMTAAQKKTMMGMSAAEKACSMKMMKMHSSMHGGRMSAKPVAMMCPHCDVAMKNGKCPMCGMTEAQMKKTKM
jgi:hypothetical protein